MAGNSSRIKGYGGEKEVERKLKEAGLEAKRVPLSGAVEGFWGDVVFNVDGREMTGEVKRRKAGFSKLYQWLARKDILFLREDREDWLVVLRMEDWLELVKKEKP